MRAGPQERREVREVKLLPAVQWESLIGKASQEESWLAFREASGGGRRDRRFGCPISNAGLHGGRCSQSRRVCNIAH